MLLAVPTPHHHPYPPPACASPLSEQSHEAIAVHVAQQRVCWAALPDKRRGRRRANAMWRTGSVCSSGASYNTLGNRPTVLHMTLPPQRCMLPSTPTPPWLQFTKKEAQMPRQEEDLPPPWPALCRRRRHCHLSCPATAPLPAYAALLPELIAAQIEPAGPWGCAGAAAGASQCWPTGGDAGGAHRRAE